MRCAPTALALLPLAPLAACALAADLGLVGRGAFAFAALGLSGILLVDALRLIRSARLGPLAARRALRRSLPLSAWSPLVLTIANRSASPVAISRLADRLPPAVTAEPAEFSLKLGPGETAELRCRIRPGERGEFTLPGPDAVLRSPWGLWQWNAHVPCPETVRVFPNFNEPARFTLLARSARLGQMGIRRTRRCGEGQEFQELREYRPGDALRQIDWKATARRRELISREFEEEQDQHIVLVLDCTRRMRHVDEEAGGSQFDQALNSALLLAHVAARQGDSVGLLACGERFRWYPPAKKAGAARMLLLASTELFPETTAMDYGQLAAELGARLKRRSLVILLTNTRAEEYAGLELLAKSLGGRHLLVVADLMEAEVAAAARREPRSPDEALRAQAILAHLRERRRFALRLRRQGCLALDLTAAELPPALVNTYLDIKQRRQL